MKTRQQISRAAEGWGQADLDNRGVICLMSEKNGDNKMNGTASVGGNPEVLVESVINAMMKSAEFTEIIRLAVTGYNDLKTQMN